MSNSLVNVAGVDQFACPTTHETCPIAVGGGSVELCQALGVAFAAQAGLEPGCDTVVKAEAVGALAGLGLMERSAHYATS